MKCLDCNGKIVFSEYGDDDKGNCNSVYRCENGHINDDFVDETIILNDKQIDRIIDTIEDNVVKNYQIELDDYEKVMYRIIKKLEERYK